LARFRAAGKFFASAGEVDIRCRPPWATPMPMLGESSTCRNAAGKVRALAGGGVRLRDGKEKVASGQRPCKLRAADPHSACATCGFVSENASKLQYCFAISIKGADGEARARVRVKTNITSTTAISGLRGVRNERAI
jgi:hypothetical protein